MIGLTINKEIIREYAMAVITYQDVEEYHARHEGNLRKVLDSLEEKIIFGRDKEHIPIYLTKGRVKSINSMYLKTRRKNTLSLDGITDFGGLRALCLFEQDIIKVHKYLVNILKQQACTLKEFKIYNWENEDYIEQLQIIVKSQFPHYEFEDAIKESGYKSIHYLIVHGYSKFQYPIEIQLRTLLQDVWGELEHTLAYKQGNIHPHIKNSFRLLSKDLQNNDILISNLCDIRDKEYRVGLFALEDAGPSEAFIYEPELLPTIFKDAHLDDAYKNYSEYISTWRDQRHNPREWAERGFEFYRALDRLIGWEQRNESLVQYWLFMEKGFLLFVQGRRDEAMKIYEEVTNKWKELYAPHFRIGEIFYIKGEIEKSLVAFDKSEELLSRQSTCDPFNVYRLKAKLALLYWLMGEQYCDIALNKILEAEVIYNKHSGSFPARIRQSLTNNLCWYHLEKYILAREKYKRSGKEQDRKAQEEAYERALDRCRTLEELLETSHEKRANDYDTVAWFCFNTYLKTKDAAFLEKAKKYCRDGWGLKSDALHQINSSSIYRSHTQEIISTEP